MPFKIKSIKNNRAYDLGGKKVRLDLLNNCKKGDYLLVQADVAVEKISMRRALDIANAYNKK